MIPSVLDYYHESKFQSFFEDKGLVRLAGCQPASSVFLSHQFSTSHQPPASQQYFSLTINQPQPPATSQPNEAKVSPFLGLRIFLAD
jgi:hypothetical protein